MTIEMIKISNIKPSKDNPRKSFDEKKIAGLAASIRTDGLLQNLVVSKPKGKKKTYRIISGERRYRALSLLIKNGDLPQDLKIPVEIKEGLSEVDTHRIATMENVQRENLSPLEEADAIVGLLQEKMTLDDVCAKTGLSQSTIKRRLALSNLCGEVREALSDGIVSLAQAEALTVGSEDQQRVMLEHGLEYLDSRDIKDRLTNDKVSVAIALFDKSQYRGTFTSDLFAQDESTYFDDKEAFWKLQNEAVEMLACDLTAEGFDPVEIFDGYCFNSWKYRKPKKDETGGAVIHVNHSGEIEIHKNIINRDLDEKAVELTEAKPRPNYSKPLCEYIAMHKTMAVQLALLDNPRIAKELAIVQMLTGNNGVILHLHASYNYFAKSEIYPSALDSIEEIIKPLFFALGKKDDPFERLINSRVIAGSMANSIEWYEALKSFTDDDLDKLHLLLTTLCFGQISYDRLDTNENSLFNRVANDLDVDMRENWIPDEPFLKRRNLTQLKEIIKESGLSRIFGNGDGYKKGALVKSLAKHFKRIRSKEQPLADEQKAYEWLPEVFQFPAIDPDVKKED